MSSTKRGRRSRRAATANGALETENEPRRSGDSNESLNVVSVDRKSEHRKLITVKQAAELLGLSYADVDRRMKSGDIPYFRYLFTGASRAAIRLFEADVIAYREKCYVPAREDKPPMMVDRNVAGDKRRL